MYEELYIYDATADEDANDVQYDALDHESDLYNRDESLGSGAEFHDGPISYDHDDPRNDFQDAGDDITYMAEVDVINDCDEEAIYDELPDEFRRSMFICHDEIIYTDTQTL